MCVEEREGKADRHNYENETIYKCKFIKCRMQYLAFLSNLCLYNL